MARREDVEEVEIEESKEEEEVLARDLPETHTFGMKELKMETKEESYKEEDEEDEEYKQRMRSFYEEMEQEEFF